MKKLTILLLLMVFTVSVYALGDTEQGQQQGQVGINRNDNANLQGQGQQQGIANSGNSSNRNDNDNRNTNLQGQGQGQDQGQLQGQLQGQGQAQGQGQGQGQIAAQGQGQSNDIAINDNSEYKSYSFSPPGLSANKGVNEGNIYSIFGGIGLASTEEYAVCMEKLNVIAQMKEAGWLSAEEANIEARKVYAQLSEATKAKRVLGVLGKTRGRHLLNFFGLIAWDSFYAEPGIGQEVIVKEKKVVTTTLDDLDADGNRGYVNE